MAGGKPNSVYFKLKQGFEQLSQRIITDPVVDLDPDLKEKIDNSLWALFLFRAGLFYWYFIRPQPNKNQTEEGADKEPIVSGSEFLTEEGAKKEPIVSASEFPTEGGANKEPIVSASEFPTEEGANKEPIVSASEFPTEEGANKEPIVSASEFPTEEGANKEAIVADIEIPAEEGAHKEPIVSASEFPAEEGADNEPNGFDWENQAQVKNDEHNLDPVECFLKEFAMPDHLIPYLTRYDFDVSDILSLKEEQMEKLGIPKARIPELLGKIKEYQSF